VALDPAPDPAAALADLAPLLPATVHAEAVGRRAGARLAVRLVNGVPEIVEALVADPQELFDRRKDQDDAIAARDGDADAALRLPMEWRVQATLTFDRLLDVPGGVSVAVSLASQTITDHVVAMTAAAVRSLVGGQGHAVLVALDAPGSAQLGRLVLAGAAGDGAAARVVLRPPALLAGETGAGPLPPAGALLGHEDEPVPPVWRRAASHAKALAAQLVWRALATSEREEDGRVVLTFHGYKKSAFLLPEPESWEPQDVTETIALRGWALHDASPDRLLALRQVASLYGTDTAPFGHAADVQASAEVIYAGLRTDAVAEAVKGSREAHAQAQDAARQTVKNATDMVKGATERMLAALVAVGAVLIANAGRALPDDTGRLLIVLVAVFLFVLAAASALLEGPLLALPARKLKQDLVHQAGLLTDEQRRRVDELPSLVAARGRITAVRWAVPAAHVLFAVLLLALGHPSRRD
jgi:hypothetical protein